jgi:hypothetical protein
MQQWHKSMQLVTAASYLDTGASLLEWDCTLDELQDYTNSTISYLFTTMLTADNATVASHPSTYSQIYNANSVIQGELKIDWLPRFKTECRVKHYSFVL